MFYSSSRPPQSVPNNRKQGSGNQRVQQVSDKDGEKLSPVDFNIRDAVSIQLPPLQWVHYNVTPSNVTVRNTGFTLMINAAFNQQTPYVCSGPLNGDYVFAQIHFHWGEHDCTGSGHAIDGVRYPLEMHVVHLKRDCANLGEAFSKKDGIAVMVHMFALREERNINLDQLTAILQFIHKPKCCARLYPTPLAEIVQPFSSDYFLYWGAVGSPRGQYRILWFLSRNVLPVSAQQLGEFRQLCNSQGRALVSNTNKPYPLAERSLFLVSPSERLNETMCGGVSQRQKQNTIEVDSQDCFGLRDAEYKSLVDLDGFDDDTDEKDENCNRNPCRNCPVPRCLQQTANINVGYPFKVNEGDTSVEESCIDLDSDPGVTVKTETKYKENTKGQKVITNVNVTTFRPQKYRTDPADALYSVVSSRGSELHLRRKPAIVRPSDPSREQACMLLSQRSSTYQTCSAPSLTGRGGYFTSKKLKSTDVSSQPIRHMSSEVAVFYRDSETWESQDQCDQVRPFNDRSPNTLYNQEYYEDTTNLEERIRINNYNKQIIKNRQTEFPENPNNGQRIQPSKNRNPVDTNNQKQPARPREHELDESSFYIEEIQDITHSEENANYQYFKRHGNNNTFPNGVKNPPISQDNKSNGLGVDNVGKYNNTNQTTDMRQYIDKHNRKEVVDGNIEINQNNNFYNIDGISKDPAENYTGNRNNKRELFEQFSESEVFTSSEYREKSQKKVIFKEESNAPLPPRSIEKGKENDGKISQRCQNEKDKRDEKTGPNADSQYKVRLLVRTTISDHRRPGKKGKQFYVTKISPVDTSYISPKTSRANVDTCSGNEIGTEEYYYAKPLDETEENLPEKDDCGLKKTYENRENSKDVSFIVNEYYQRSSEEFYNKQHRKHKEYVANSIVPKENIDQKQNRSQQSNPTFDTPPQTIQKVQNENTNDTYEYDEEYMESDLQESKNETLYRKTKSIHPNQPSARNKQISNNGLPRQIARVTPENKPLNNNENTLIQKKENITNNLVEKTNTYRCQNDPDIKIVDRTVTGTVGETKSTDVFIKTRRTEMIKPEKTDVSEEVDYSLVKSKHTKPQCHVKEPPANKSQPQAVITQTLSLDQKVTGHSHVRQTVEYHNERGCSESDRPRPPVQEVRQEPVEPAKEVEKSNCTTEMSVEENLEQFSSVKRSQHFIATKKQPSIQQQIKKEPLDKPVCIKDPSKRDQFPEKPRLNVSFEQQTKENGQFKQSKEIRTVLSKGRTDLDVNKNNNIDQSTEEYYTDKKSSETMKSHKYFRRESNSNKLPNKNTTAADGNICEKPVNTKNNCNEKQEIDDSIPNTEITIPTPDVIIKQQPSTQPNVTRLNENLGNLKYEYEETSSVNKRMHHRTKIEKTIAARGKETGNVTDDTQKQQKLPSQKQGERKMLENKEDNTRDQNKISTIDQNSRGKEPCQSKKNNLFENENNYEEITEESFTGYTSQKIMKKTITQKKGDPSYKLPKTTTCETPDTNHTITIKKVEIPEPQYITRIPKQPLVEYEAYPVDPQQPFEIITETSEEISSTVKTKRTFMMFKRINGKAILNQPSVIEPMKVERNHNFLDQPPGLMDSFGVSNNQTGVERNNSPVIREVQIQKPLQQENCPDQINGTSKYINQTKCKDDERDLNEYELSESFASQRQSTRKEKRYKLTIRQPSVNKEDVNEPNSCPRKQPSILLEDTSTNKIKANNQSSSIESPLIIGQTKTDGRYTQQTFDLDTNLTNNKTKIGNRQQQISVTDQPRDASCKVPVRVEPVQPRENTDLEFYETTTKEEKYESSQTRYLSMRGGTRIVNTRPSEMSDQYQKFIENAGKDLKYSEDEPTRDSNVQGRKCNDRPEGLSKINESSSEDQDNGRNKYQENNNQRQRSQTSVDQNSIMGPGPVSKTDGDIVIFIRQPRSKKEQVNPKITVDVTEKLYMTSAEMDAQKVQVHETKRNTSKDHGAPKNPIVPRKSKSAGNYPSFSSSDSNEEQVIDTTHYNLTLKSETQVEIEGGRSGRVKSKNEVTVTPLGSPAATRRGKTVRNIAQEELDSGSCDDDGDSSESTTSFEETFVDGSTGFNQSPIRINTQTTERIHYPKIQFFNHWDASGDALLENNGKTLRGSYIQETSIPYIRGGPLRDDYVFTEVHFHWGYKDCCGAEHIIDGKRHTIEAHFLYFKKEYGLLKEAIQHVDGIAIVAVNLTVGGPPNPQFGELVKDIHLLREPNTGAYVPARSLFSWAKTVIESSTGYYSYKGSLTLDPPLVESVTWMVFPEPIVFCCQQSQGFRKLKSSKGAFLTKNFRPPQPLNNRTVYFVPS